MGSLGEVIDRILRNYPPVYYWVRTKRLAKSEHPDLSTPPLCQDVIRYSSLFEKACENFSEIISPYLPELNWPLGKVYNGPFEAVDCELYYCIIRRFKPNRIIEVGAGNSAWFAIDALKRNKHGSVIAIDPEPTIKLPKAVEHIRHRVEEIPVHLFASLEANDILFFDSSHTTSEATYHVENVLPALRRGVLIHHHDILWPYEHYHLSDREKFGEPDVILGYYLRNHKSYQILTGAAFVCYEDLEMVRNLIKSFEYRPKRRPGSLWARKAS